MTATVVAVANNKGGVGKTTTSLNLAYGLHARGRKVLMVDLDGQCNTTVQYKARVSDVATVFDLMTSHGVRASQAVQSHPSYGDIIPGDILMVRASEQMAMLDNREYMLTDALDDVRDDYEYIILDCPPALDIIVKNALIAADEVVIPLECDGYAVESLHKIMAQIDVIRGNRRLNPRLSVLGILLNNFDGNTRISKEFLASLPAIAGELGADVFDTRIRKCVKVSNASAECEPLQEHAPGCTAALDYESFVGEFLERDGGKAA